MLILAFSVLLGGCGQGGGTQILPTSLCRARRGPRAPDRFRGWVPALHKTFDEDWSMVRTGASPTPEGIRSEEAEQHVGEDVVVTGRVASVFKGGHATCLHAGASDFVVVVFAEDLRNFPMPLDKMCANKKIRVHGVIKRYHDQPEIVVHSPAQIEVLP